MEPSRDPKTAYNQEKTSAAVRDFYLLMSLALKDLLNPEQENRFRRYLEQDLTLARIWATWQEAVARADR